VGLFVVAGHAEALLILSIVATAGGEVDDVIDDLAGYMHASFQAQPAEGLFGEHLLAIALASAAALALIVVTSGARPRLWFAPAWRPEPWRLGRH
jgi:hypothetical protein